MSNNQLKTFVRFDGSGRIVPSSMVIAYSMPKVGKWKEINSTTSPTTTIAPGPPTVTIGTQLWTTTNLDVTTYRNGDTIPEVTDQAAWGALTTGAWCYYNNDPSNGAIYGKLYNWFAVNDPRGLAPVGFHVPTDDEFATLGTFLGGDSVAGSKLKSNTLWNGTNESGFSGLPGGARFASNFNGLGSYGYCWSATPTSPEFLAIAWVRSLQTGSTFVDRLLINDESGLSVRLIKD
jgi:uncharacterized protein (TIGR02145 family)